MKSSFKFLVIGLVLGLLLVSNVANRDNEASALTSLSQDTVEFLGTGADPAIVGYYKPGNATATTTAAFWIADNDLETTQTGKTATWTTLSAAVQDGEEGGRFNIANGQTAATSTTFSTTNVSDHALVAASYSADSPTSTPLTSAPTVTVGGTDVLVTSSDLTTGVFGLFSDTAAATTVIATFAHHIQDSYTGNNTGSSVLSTQNRVKVTSTSDSTGEWVTISEVASLGASTADPDSKVFRGQIGLSTDSTNTASGDYAVWVQDGDTLTVTFYKSDHTTVIDSTTAVIDSTNPTISSVVPADGKFDKETSPSVSFTIEDGGSGTSSSAPGGNVAMVINGCPVADSELTFPFRSASKIDVVFSLAPTTAKWADAASPSCGARTSGGFGIVSDNLGLNNHGTAFQWKIVATDVAGNSKTLETTSLDLTIDTVAPAMLSAVSGTGWNTADKITKTQANSIKVAYTETLDTATVDTTDFLVDGVVPTALIVAGLSPTSCTATTCLKDELVFLEMANDFAGSARAKVEMVGSIKDQAGNEQKPATGKTVAQTISQADDGIKAVISDVTTTAKLLADAGTATITFTSNEALAGSDLALGDPCTCLNVVGTESGTITNTKITVTLSTPTSATATFSEASFDTNATAGIFGVQIQARDGAANVTNTGLVKVTDEDVSSQFTTAVAAGVNKAVKLTNWPVADYDGDGIINAADFTVKDDGVAVVPTIISVEFTEAETVTMTFATAIVADSSVVVTYRYVDPSQVIEIDAAAPGITFDPTTGSSITNTTPFVNIIFDDDEYAGDSFKTVTVTKATMTDPDGVILDLMTAGTDGATALSTTDNIKFTYLPAEELALGLYTVTARGKDEAGNETADVVGTFTVKARALTEIALRPGWSLISLPGTPTATDINAVGFPTAVDTILSYDPRVTGGWSTAVRDDEGNLVGTLRSVDAKHGYWVHSTTFDPLKVDIPGLSGGAAVLPPTIQLAKGWNLIAAGDSDPVAFKATAKDSDVSWSGVDWAAAFYYNAASTSFVRFIPTPRLAGEGVTNDGQVQFGLGYWVYVNTAGTIVP